MLVEHELIEENDFGEEKRGKTAMTMCKAVAEIRAEAREKPTPKKGKSLKSVSVTL